MKVVIVANGQIRHPEIAGAALAEADFVIAANGGTHHCLQLDHQPDLIVGDLDSLDETLLAELENAGVEIQRHPVHKDATDLELALEQAQARRATELVILGAVGGRWDQTLANFHLIASPRWYQLRVKVVDGPQRIFPVHAGHPFSLDGQVGDLVSLIPVGGDAAGITIEGFSYPLKDETLKYDSSRGVSNVLANPPGRISLKRGSLLCLVIRGGEEKLLDSGGS